MEILVFQEQGSGVHKIEGVQRYGNDLQIVEIISIDGVLPEFIDDPQEYISNTFQCDLVLNFLKHPDLVHYLMGLCEKKFISIVSPGKKGTGFIPFTCCGLGRNNQLGVYGEQFGLPEYKVRVGDGKIEEIKVVRGAPCGATWDALQEYIGCTVEDVLTRLPRQVQYFCSANPSGFDPVSGKSPVHYAGYVHMAALKKAIDSVC